MQLVFPCDLCQRVYEPDQVHGVRQLKQFRAYTVDLRLQEFRTVVAGKGMIFVPFTSRKGQQLLRQMHQEVMQERR